MPRFQLETKFILSGSVTVEADTLREARLKLNLVKVHDEISENVSRHLNGEVIPVPPESEWTWEMGMGIDMDFGELVSIDGAMMDELDCNASMTNVSFEPIK